MHSVCPYRFCGCAEFVSVAEVCSPSASMFLSCLFLVKSSNWGSTDSAEEAEKFDPSFKSVRLS